MIHYSNENQRMTQATIVHVLDNHEIESRCVGLSVRVCDGGEWIDITQWTVGEIKNFLGY